MRREYTKRPDKFDAGLSELSDVQLKIKSFALIFHDQVHQVIQIYFLYEDKQNMVLIALFQRVVTPHFNIIRDPNTGI